MKGLITRDGGESVLRQQLPQIKGTFSEPHTAVIKDAQLDVGRVYTEKDQAVLQQLSVAQEALTAIELRRKRGDRFSDQDYHKWSVRLLEAERAISKTRDEHVAALEAHRARMNATKDHAARLYRTGKMDLLPYLDTVYWTKEAAAWLDKARQDPTRPVARR